VDGRLITSNYTGGSASAYSVAEDGSIGEPLQFINAGEGSHIHCAVLSPDGKYLFLTDLGRDCVFRFDLGPDGQPFGESVFAWQNVDSFPYGPRHMVFSADGKYAYLLCELGDMLVVFSYVDGALTPVQTLKAYDGDGHGSADIHLSPDGKFLYTSHRLKEDGISIYKVESGLVERVGFCPTGKHPRNFAISPDGKYLLCACRDDNRIEVYRRDALTGMLEATGQDIAVGAPVCVHFLP
jgi:6-phosphogluconolactonase (cycloisomerase 2 family)